MKIAIAVLLALFVVGRPVGTSADSASPTPSPLAGTTWHTIHIAGDSLFFLIDEIGVRFGADGRFGARVRFVDGQQIRKTGTYRLDGATMTVTIDGVPAQKLIQYSLEGDNLIATDKAFGVTITFVRGPIADTSWF